MHRRQNDGDIQLLARAHASGQAPRAVMTFLRQPEIVQYAGQGGGFRHTAARELGVLSAGRLDLQPTRALVERCRRHAQRVIVQAQVFLPDVIAGLGREMLRIAQIAAYQGRHSRCQGFGERHIAHPSHERERAQRRAVVLRTSPARHVQGAIGVDARLRVHACAVYPGEICVLAQELSMIGDHAAAPGGCREQASSVEQSQ